MRVAKFLFDIPQYLAVPHRFNMVTSMMNFKMNTNIKVGQNVSSLSDISNDVQHFLFNYLTNS